MNITVILNGFKRSQHFKKQLEAIENQTIKPKEILLWQNLGENFDKHLTSRTTHSSCNKNLGVWARFAYALNADTEYVCVFDDDTIPGKKWLENCLNTIQEHDGLLGTIGVKFQTTQSYHPNTRVGWANPNNNTEEVDIVGHSWFFRREWLSTFWRELPDVKQTRLVGEDMHFSYTLQKYLNKKTYVPPHPIDDMEMWGSKPDTGWGIGQDSAALSMFPLNISLMSMEYQKYINRGFKPLFTR
jgi:glycosyltransferase involved in cell wall biosynthesis